MTLDQLFTYYLPITVTLFVTMLSSYLVAGLIAYFSRKGGPRSGFFPDGRAERVLHPTEPSWRVIRVAGALAGFAICLWAYPAARSLALLPLRHWL